MRKLAGARGHFAVAGTPEEIADIVEDWFTSGAADGFNVMPPIIKSQLELFAQEVVPILQSAGCSGTNTKAPHYGIISDWLPSRKPKHSLNPPEDSGE